MNETGLEHIHRSMRCGMGTMLVGMTPIMVAIKVHMYAALDI
jgi:hypothetical protein